MEFTAAVLVFLALSLLFAAVRQARAAAPASSELLRRMGNPAVVSSVAEEAAVRRRRAVRTTSVGGLLAQIHLLQLLEENMWQAGIYASPSDVLLLMAALFIVGVGIIYMLWHSLLFAIVVGGLLAGAPILYVRWRRRQRLEAFAAQLPDVLDMLKSSLEAGHSFLRGLQIVVEEFSDPIRSEIRLLLEQTRLGMPLARALDDMLGRMPDESLRFLVVSIKIQSEVGNSLAEIIGRLAETIRTRQRIRLQIRALTAQPRMSGIIVGLLPVVVMGFLLFVRPEYVGVLFHDPLGHKILEVAAGLDLLAFVIIRKILRSDF